MNSAKTKLETGKSKLESGFSRILARIAELLRRMFGREFRFSNFQFPFPDFISAVPWRLVFAAAGLLLGLALLHERDARLRRGFELEQLKGETAARVKDLEGRAAAALLAANRRNALVIRELEASRLKLARQGDQLRQRLAALERDERVRVERVATLPSQELAERVASRLDAGREEGRDSGFGTRDSGKPADSVNARLSDLAILESPGHPITGSHDRPGATAAERAPAMGTSPLQRDGGHRPPLQPALALDTAAQRKVETAFVELESCRRQAAVRDALLANCRDQAAAGAAVSARLSDSVRELNQAVRLKDEILARRGAEHRAELKAARGGRWARFRRAVTYMAVGVVVGAVVAR